MALELDPDQPEAVVRAIERLLAGDARRPVDPWWAAGLTDRSGGGDGAPAQDAWGGPRVVEP